MVMVVMVFTTLVAIYAFWIRPILKSRPAFRELYREEENFFAARAREAQRHQAGDYRLPS